ncbi:MAG: Mor transcription activator family protein [Pseudomonadota bacterium]|nr:Mor transcription activator family protein [Pseudomonadota bacterium]
MPTPAAPLSKPRQRGENLLSELESALAAGITQEGIAPDAASRVAIAVTDRISEQFGGIGAYIPKGGNRHTQSRNAEIAREFTGNNIDELVARYHLTEVCIRQILKRERAMRAPAPLPTP